MSYQLKSISPKTVLDTYSAGMQINFDIAQDMDCLVENSMYITFQLELTALPDKTLFLDNKVGTASFFENMTTECQLFQEVISDYARLHKMLNTAQYSNDVLTSGLKNTNELLMGDPSHSNAILRESNNKDVGLCHKPYCALNNMSGALSFQKVGRIKFSYKLPSPQKIFYGAWAGANTPVYVIKNIELHYLTTPTPAPSVQVRVVEDVQKLIQTTNTTINNLFINPIDSVLVSFATTTSENSASENSLVCQNPNIDKMSWVWQDQSNRLVSYEIQTIEEQVLSAFSVLNTMGCNIDLRDYLYYKTQDGVNSSTDNFLVGLNIGGLTNFSGSGLGLNVKINRLNEKYNCHMYGFGAKTIV